MELATGNGGQFRKQTAGQDFQPAREIVFPRSCKPHITIQSRFPADPT